LCAGWAQRLGRSRVVQEMARFQISMLGRFYVTTNEMRKQ
jgi:hypothetical protein